MPPKMITCSVCNESVMKAQTYATGGTDEEGNPLRACKAHEGVLEKADSLRAEEIKRLKKAQEPKKFPAYVPPPQDVEDNHCKCWCCEREGILLRDVYKLRLVIMEKMKLQGKVWNPFEYENSEIPGLKALLGDLVIMHQFELDEDLYEKYKSWEARFSPACRDAVSFLKMIQLCFDCQEITGIAFDMKKLEAPSLQALMLINVAYDNSELKEQAKQMAEVLVLKDEINETKRN